MQIFKTKNNIISFLKNKRKDNIITGFVPTMGCLHEGHMHLINVAKKECKIVICSIFINPIQFNAKEDFDKYPRSLDEDIKKLSLAKCDVLYAPEITDLYEKDEKEKSYNFNGLDTLMEGEYRGSHFNGVATVLEKLFLIINPNNSYFGEKDLQQLQIVKILVNNLGLPINIIGVKTIRDENGVAISSRNQLLSRSDLKKAALIYKALCYIKENHKHETLQDLRTKVMQMFKSQNDIKLEYLEFVSLKKLQKIPYFLPENENAVCIAAYISRVRLIDNIIF